MRYDFFFTVTLRPFIMYHSSYFFPSRNVTKNAETHPLPMPDVIIEQPPIILDELHRKILFLWKLSESIHVRLVFTLSVYWNTFAREVIVLIIPQLLKKISQDYSIFRSSRSQIFSNTGVLKNYAEFTRKHLCRSLSLVACL